MLPKVRKTIRKKKVTTARLDAFARGLIWGMHLAKVPRAQKRIRNPSLELRFCVGPSNIFQQEERKLLNT